MLLWFVETVKAAIQNESVNWIIKLHPANVWKLKRDNMEQQKLSELVLLEEFLGSNFTLPSHVKLLLPDTKISTQSLFSLTSIMVSPYEVLLARSCRALVFLYLLSAQEGLMVTDLQSIQKLEMIT